MGFRKVGNGLWALWIMVIAGNVGNCQRKREGKQTEYVRI